MRPLLSHKAEALRATRESGGGDVGGGRQPRATTAPFPRLGDPEGATVQTRLAKGSASVHEEEDWSDPSMTTSWGLCLPL